jgi:hypothetical protein
VIFDFKGSKMMEEKYLLKEGLNQLEISVFGLSPGIYQFQSGGDEPLSFRFVKH